MHRHLRKVWAWAWGIVALGLIATAVLLTLLRLALPFLGEYRAEVEQRVGDYLDMPVSIGHLDVEWHGLGPRLRLADLRIEGRPPDGGDLRFREAYLDLALAPQAEGLPFRIGGVSLMEVEIEAVLDADGRVSFLGFTFDPASRRAAAATAARTVVSEALPAAVADALDRLSGVGRLALLDASLVLQRPGGRRTVVPDIDLHLRNEGTRHQAAVSVTLPPEFGERLRVVLDVSGPAGAYRDWQGAVYLEGRDLALGAWSGLSPRAPVTARGRLDVSAWADWSAGRIRGVLADARAAGLTLEVPADGRSVSFRRMTGRFAWNREQAGGWTLDVGGLHLERGGRAWPETGFSIARDGDEWRLDADHARIEDVAALARVLPRAPAERLVQLAPRGTVRGLHAAGTGTDDFALRGTFEDLGWSAHARVPGVAGLDGRGRLDAAGGTLELATAGAAIDAPRLFRGRLPVAQLEGTLFIERGPDRWTLRAPRVVAANDDIYAVGRLHVAAGGDASPWLDLQMDFRDGDVGAASRYLPAGVMPDRVVSWLDRALQGGRVVDGTMLLRGPADAFPYRGHEGVFDVDFRVTDGRLDYAPGWPALDGLEGRVHFDGPGLTIAAASGRMGETRIAPLHARFEDLKSGRLQVRAEAEGPFADLVRMVDASPLQGRAAGFLDGARAEGPARLDLALDLPLKDIGDTRVQGLLRLAGSRLEQPRYDLALGDLDGEVAFTRDSLAIEGLAASLRGRPVTIDARTEDGAIRVTAAGRLALSELLHEPPGVVARHTHGRADWHIHVRVPTADAERPVTISGDSDLAGIAVTLPEPFAKEAGAGRRLHFELALEGALARGTLAYGDDVSTAVALARVDDRLVLDRATLRVGTGPARLRAGPGVHLEGRLEALDLEVWRDLLVAADGSAAASPAVDSADLQVARLAYRGRVLSDLQVRAERTDAGWRLDLASNELIGDVTVPVPLRADGRPVTVRLSWLDLTRLGAPAEEEAAAGADARPPDPATLPPLDLRIERLKTADATLHGFVVVTAPLRNGLAIHRLQLDNPGLGIEGQGQWLGGEPQQTALRLTLRADDLGAGLGALGQGGTFRGGRGRITVDVGWSAPPWAPDAASLQGHAGIDLRDGAISEVEPGPARLLGLFSLNVLRLDFQGLLRKGFPFERIRGRVDFTDGSAYTGGITVEGPAGRLRVSGRTGLVARDYDQTVTFRPSLSESLPIIGALSGGPATGLAVALIQGLLRNMGADVERAAELRYTLTGSWADPTVERVKTESAVTDSPNKGPAGEMGP